MSYVIKWRDESGRLGASDAHRSPSEALAWLRANPPWRATGIWAESPAGLRFELKSPATARDPRRATERRT